MKNRGTGAGGANTNVSGKRFEKTVDVLGLLLNIDGFTTSSKEQTGNSQYYNILYRGHDFGCFTREQGFYRIFNNGLESGGLKKIQDILSAPMYPDAVIFSEAKGVAIIIEKKFQDNPGSTDEKLQTCDYKRIHLLKLFNMHFKKKIKLFYLYFLNDHFKGPKYKDVKEYILFRKCYYFHSDNRNELKNFIKEKLL